MSADTIINLYIIRSTLWRGLQIKSIKLQEDLKQNKKKKKQNLTVFDLDSYILCSILTYDTFATQMLQKMASPWSLVFDPHPGSNGGSIYHVDLMA